MPTETAGGVAARSSHEMIPNAAETLHRLFDAAVAAEDADLHLASQGHASELHHAVRHLCALGFSADKPEARLDLHRALYKLYDLQLCRPSPDVTVNQDSVELLRIRKMIEGHWMAWEERRLSGLSEEIAPDGIGDAIKSLWREHASYGHKVFDFMRENANRDQIVRYFTTDYALNMRFYDLIVLSLVGIEEDVRMEVAGNFWDEMGQGNPARTHVRLYRDLLDYIGVEDDPRAFVEALGWEGLAGHNLLVSFALSRRAYFRSIGALAITELADPDQYTKLLDGCRRVGIGTDRPGVLDYYSEHVEVDALHGDGWIDHVIVPVLRRYPDQARTVLEGAAMRLNTSQDYWDWQLATMKQMVDGASDLPALA